MSCKRNKEFIMLILLENSQYEFEAVVSDDTDFESEFDCYCVLSGQQLRNVKPWLFNITILEEENV